MTRWDDAADRRRGITGPSARRMVAAWHAAALDLEVEVLAPYEFSGFGVVALVPSFGSLQGTLVVLLGVDRKEEARIREEASAVGLFVSAINPQSYSHYSRVVFMDLLNDWGWFGATEFAPEWYSGEAWTS